MERRTFSKELKLQVLQELETGKTLTQVSQEHELKSDLVCRWRNEYQQNPAFAFSGKGNPSREETKEAQLERKIGQLTMENDFIKRVNKALQMKLLDIKKTRQEP